MIIEKVTVKDYMEIAKKHKIFLWHFLQKNQCSNCLTLFSYFDDAKEGRDHRIRIIIDHLKIPYFESYTSESVDFLINNGVKHNQLWNGGTFAPIILGFKDGVSVANTGQVCYCTEGLIRIISKLDITLLENSL